MSNEIEEQIDTGSDSDVETIETGEENGTPDKNSNKSNFKKLSEAKKALERELTEAREEIESWRSENPELVASTLSKKSDGIDKGDLALFLVQNPEAKSHLDEVKEYLTGMKNPDLDKAWKYVKPTIIKESESNIDFSIKNNAKPIKVDLKSIKFEDTGSLSPEQRKEWRKINGY